MPRCFWPIIGCETLLPNCGWISGMGCCGHAKVCNSCREGQRTVEEHNSQASMVDSHHVNIMGGWQSAMAARALFLATLLRKGNAHCYMEAVMNLEAKIVVSQPEASTRIGWDEVAVVAIFSVVIGIAGLAFIASVVWSVLSAAVEAVAARLHPPKN